MSEYGHSVKELETELMRLMKAATKNGRKPSVLWGEALKLIQTARKTDDLHDVTKAYDMVLSLSQDKDSRRYEQIIVALGTLAWYSLRFIPHERLSVNEIMAFALVPIELDNPMIQHYITFWHLQPCYQMTPDDDLFWHAWGFVYRLCVKYRAGYEELLVRRLFEVYGREVNIRIAS